MSIQHTRFQRFLRLLLAGLMVVTTAAPTAALAQSKPTRSPPATPSSSSSSEDVKAGKVKVEVRVVYATTAHSRVDPSLGKLTRYLSNLKYTGYELIETESSQLSEGASNSFQLAGGRKVKVTVMSKDDRRAKLRVQITSTKNNSKLLDTTLTVNRNGTFIVAGPKYQSGILVLPLTVKY